MLDQKKNRDKLNAISIDGYKNFVFTSRTGKVFYSEKFYTKIYTTLLTILEEITNKDKQRAFLQIKTKTSRVQYIRGLESIYTELKFL